MKQKILAGIIVGLAISALVGCGKDEDKNDTANQIKVEAASSEEPAATAVAAAPAAEPAEAGPAVALAADEVDDSESYNKENLIEADDNIIYDDNGVVITFDGININSHATNRYRTFLTVDNENQENKKVYIHNIRTYINGFMPASIQSDIKGNDIEGLVSGAEHLISYDCTIGSEETDINAVLDCENMPVETIEFIIDLRIGSDSEEFCIEKTMETKEYNEYDMDNLYGEYAGTTTAEERDYFKEQDSFVNNPSLLIRNLIAVYGDDYEDGFFSTPVNIFYKKNSNGGITVSAVQSHGGKDDDGIGISEKDNVTTIDLYVNGKIIKPDEIWRTYKGQDLCVKRYNKSEDEIRREYEISNSEPLEYTVGWPGVDVSTDCWDQMTRYLTLFTN